MSLIRNLNIVDNYNRIVKKDHITFTWYNREIQIKWQKNNEIFHFMKFQSQILVPMLQLTSYNW